MRKVFSPGFRKLQDATWDTAKYSDPVGQLVEINSEGDVIGRLCTGFNIQYDSLTRTTWFLTAGHCLERTCLYPSASKSQLSKIRISYKYDPGESEVLLPIKRVFEHGKCSDDNTDYVILALSSRAHKYGELSLSGDLLKRGDPVTVIQHPNGRRKNFSYGKIIYTTDKRWGYSAYTLPGSSGSPVISYMHGTVNAIHTRGNRNNQTGNSGVPISEIVRSSLNNKNSFFASPLSDPLNRPQGDRDENTVDLDQRSGCEGVADCCS